MPIIKRQKLNFFDIVKFSDVGDATFQLIDIIGDSKDPDFKIQNFLETARYFVYSARLYIDLENARKNDVKSIEFKIFDQLPNNFSRPVLKFDSPINLTSDDNLLQASKKILVDQNSVKYEAFKNTDSISFSSKDVKKLTNFSFQGTANNSLFVNKKDPAHELSPGNYNFSTPNSMLNFGNFDPVNFESTADFSRSYLNGPLVQPISLQKIRNEIKKSKIKNDNHVLSSFVEGSSSTENIGDQGKASSVAMIFSNSSKKEIEVKLFVDAKKIGNLNYFYIASSLVFGELNSKLRTLDDLTEVKHERQISNFLANAEPVEPKIISNSANRVVIEIKKADPSVKKIAIIRVKSNQFSKVSAIQSIGSITFDEENVNYFIDDSIDNIFPNVITYRFICQNSDGTFGGFSSIISEPVYSSTSKDHKINSDSRITARAINRPEGVLISVDVPAGAVQTIRLLKTDMGSFGGLNNPTSTVLTETGDSFIFVDGKAGTFEFLDRDVFPRRKYKYVVACRFGFEKTANFSEEVISSAQDTITRVGNFHNSNIVFSVGTLNSSLDENGNSVFSFDLNASNDKDSAKNLKQSFAFLENQDNFLTLLQNDTQRQKNSIAFYVERIDRSNGFRHGYGIFPPGTFTDNFNLRQALKISEPETGKKYEYVIKPCVRPPESFIKAGQVGFISNADSTTNEITKVSANKFAYANGIYGELPSQQTLSLGMNDEKNWLSGQLSDEMTLEFTLQQENVNFAQFSVVSRKNYNLISWALSGNISSVNYFLIWCVYNGNKQLIGTCSSTASNDVITFKDTTFCKEVGAKIYQVEVISVNNERILLSRPISTNLDSSCSSFYFENAVTFFKNLNGNMEQKQVITNALDDKTVVAQSNNVQIINNLSLAQQKFDNRNDNGILPFVSRGSPDLLRRKNAVKNSESSNRNAADARLNEISLNRAAE